MALGGKRWQFGFWDPDGFQAFPGKHHIVSLNTVLTGSFDAGRRIAILKSCFCDSLGIPALKPHEIPQREKHFLILCDILLSNYTFLRLLIDIHTF